MGYQWWQVLMIMLPYMVWVVWGKLHTPAEVVEAERAEARELAREHGLPWPEGIDTFPGNGHPDGGPRG